MNNVQHGNLLFSADTERTREYYKVSNLCDCDCCRYYSSKIGGMYPQLEKFLLGFGVDITKPDEAASIKTDREIFYTVVGYTVCGQIEQGEDETIIIDGLKISFCNGFDFPNEQTQPYFSVAVEGIKIRT